MDAWHLARLLYLRKIAAVTLPCFEQQAARDFVRACDDVRENLVSTWPRLSKLSLRQGIVHHDDQPRTGSHDLGPRLAPQHGLDPD